MKIDVNLLDLGLLVQHSKVENFDLKKVIGFRCDHPGRDIVMGIVLPFQLGGPLLIGVFGVVSLL